MIPQRHQFERARKANLARELEQAREQEASLADLASDSELAPEWRPPRLASERLSHHPAFRVISDLELVPMALERAECNGIDALDSDDPVNALCAAGWEQDCWLEPSHGDGAGHLDTLLIHLIRDVRRLKAQGREAEAEHEAYRRVQQLGERLIDWMRHSESPQRVALDELYSEHQDREELALMTAAGV
jgi:rhodanese-related sulfurtransferase